MPAAIYSGNANQSAYRAQVANGQNERVNSGATNSLKSTEKMGRALGLDTTGVQNALKTVSGNRNQESPSTKVSLSSEGVARLQAEGASASRSGAANSAEGKRQFKSVDDALAYGASRAAEQANARYPRNAANAAETNATNSRNEASAARPEKRQFKSVDDAIAYGASRAAEQANARSPKNTANAAETNATNSRNEASAAARPEKRQFKSVDDAIAYGAGRAAEQANARSPKNTANAAETNATSSRNEASATARPERRQFKSVDEAISYGAQRAVDQYAKQQNAIRG